MPKKKPFKYHRWAITISPQSGLLTPVKITEIFLALVKKSKKYAYVIENGKKGDHPHLHALIEEHTDKRTDSYKKSHKNIIVKHTPITPFIYDAKPSFNPLYWLDKYMEKENSVINVGFDLLVIRSKFKIAKREILDLTSHLLPLNKTNFLYAYRDLLTRNPKFKSNYTYSCATYQLEVCHLFDINNYHMGWLLANPKVAWRNILFHHNISHLSDKDNPTQNYLQ